MNREHLRSDGRPKLSFLTRAGAKQFLRRIMADGRDPGQPYRCAVCGNFHIGHYPTSQRLRSAKRRRHRQTLGGAA